MTDLAPAAPTRGSRSLEGILCLVVSMVLFVMQDGMMKSMLDDWPVWMLIAARAVMTVLIFVPLIVRLGAPHRLLTPLWPLHLARAVLFTAGFSMYYAAFPLMPLATVSTIFFASPLVVALLAVVLLGERIGPHRAAAVAVGFAGVVIAMNPGGEAFSLVALLPLTCAATYALSQVIASHIGDRESTLTVGLYTIALAGVLIVPTGWIYNQIVEVGPEMRHLRWEWPVPDAAGLAQLALLGAIGMAAYTLASRAYQIAPASLVAPFDYTYLPLATLMAWGVWGEVPLWSTVLGMGLIVAGGLYLALREIRSARAAGRVTAEAVVAPGNPLPQMGRAPDTQQRPGP